MPKPGGTAGKLGDLYETLWTVENAIDVIEGRSKSITLESFGNESLGVEFVVQADSRSLEFHSVKRQKVGGDWSIAELCRPDRLTKRSILGDLFSKRTLSPNCGLCFVSATGANELRELTEQAKLAVTSSDFVKRLSNKSLQTKFRDKILPLCNGDENQAFESLKCLEVRLWDHFGLQGHIERRLSSLFYRLDGSTFHADDVRRSIGEFIVEKMGSEFSTDDLLQFVTTQGLGLRDWKIDKSVRVTVEKANSRYRATTESELINRAQIAREVVPSIIQSLLGDSSRGSLIIAPGGYGKSCVLTQCIEQLSQKNTPYLCLRMDSFSPCNTAKQLGEQIDLPESPAVILAGIADNSKCVLVVDQLDAMSIVSGRNSQMWEIFDELIREVQNYANMRLLLACRDFDLNHDQRLRTLGSEESGFIRYELTTLTSTEVRKSLTHAKLDHLDLPESSVELLRIPFHLLLFLEGEPSYPFTAVGELYSRYWNRKRQNLHNTLGRLSHWNEIIDALTSRMSDTQLLFAPTITVGTWADDAKAMVSENVLIDVSEHKQFRFFHESFFDYAFARRFCERGGHLLAMLDSGEQHLFRRAQVRQVLSFRRENDFQQYLSDVVAIFDSPNVRFHIKRMVASEFRRIERPTLDEWRILEPHVLVGDLSRYLLSAIRSHVGWFDLLESLGVFERWLSSDGELANIATWLLEAPDLHISRSTQIAQRIAPFAKRGGNWRIRTLRVMAWGQSSRSPEMAALHLNMIEQGAYDTYKDVIAGGDYWSQYHDLDKENPRFVIDVLGTWFDRAVQLCEDGAWNFLDKWPANHSHSGALLICSAADKLPHYFVEQMLPRVRSVVKKTEVFQSDEVFDRTWPWLNNSGDPSDIHDAVLLALRRALQHLAQHDPDLMRSYAATIINEPHRTFTYLLLRAWIENPKEFANECATYLIGDNRRLNIGYSSWSTHSGGTGESAISRMALSAISPHCSSDLFAALEDSIIGYCDAYEKSTPNWRGAAELMRLRSLDANLISRKGVLRIEELERKFPQLSDAIAPEDDKRAARFIGSPITPEVAEKMSDKQWISAMKKYNGSTDRSRGGPIELSRLLSDFARKDRVRFLNLVSEIPDDVGPIYFSAILDGICSRYVNLTTDEREVDRLSLESIPTNVFEVVIERLHNLPNRPCGSAIVGCIERIAGRLLPTSFFEIVSFYAIHDPDPVDDVWKENGDGTRAYGGDPHFHGINTVRGHAARCIEALLFSDESRLEFVKKAIISLADDPIIAVRTCAIRALLPMLNIDRDFAVELFLTSCQNAEVIWTTSPFEHFIHYAIGTHYRELRDLLQAALNSNEKKAVESVARQITIADLLNIDVLNDASVIREGDETMRATAAAVFAQNITHPAVGELCANYLKEFFNDESPDVRQEASATFHRLKGDMLLKRQELISHYIESRSFESNTDWLLHSLVDCNCELPKVICRTAERILEFVKDEGGDIAKHEALVAHHLATLVVRQYDQSKDHEIKTRCLDLIDRMEKTGYYGIGEELQKLDR